jgi:hypothetical protein
MKIILSFMALFIMINANSQTKPINFTDCEIEQMFVSADTEPKWSCDSIEMVDFMNKYIKDENLNLVNEGKIIIGILIYPDGKTCCFSFANLTKIELNVNNFKKVINKMPNWSPGIQKGEKITFLKQQVFKIQNGEFILN